MTGSGAPPEQGRARVLIVEDDPVLAFSVIKECLDAGLEPKVCLGAERASDCPGLSDDGYCPRTSDVEATLVTIRSGVQRRAAPTCVAGRTVLAGERPLVGEATRAILGPDRVLEYPYDPHDAAWLLLSLVKDERRRKAWTTLRDRVDTNA